MSPSCAVSSTRHGWLARVRASTRRSTWLRDETGSSPVTAVGGVLMFLAFVLLAAQTTIHLFASSRIGALALEAATRGARADDARCATAIGWVDARLGTSTGMSVSCTTDGEVVNVRVHGPSPAPALALLAVATDLDTLDRRATVRIETFR